MEKVGLQIALEGSGGFSWGDNSGEAEWEYMAFRQFIFKITKGHFGWKRLFDWELCR